MIEKLINKIPPEQLNPALDAGLYLAALADRGFARKADSSAEMYLNVYGQDEKIDRSALKKDMIRTYIRERFKFGEYADYQFFGTPVEERRDYISEYELFKTYGHSKRNVLPGDKYGRYLLFREFFHRDALFIRFDGSAREQEDFDRFKAAHDSFIMKPCRGSKGHGIQLFTPGDDPVLSDLAKHNSQEVLLEEIIIQGDELGRFHPQSINTVRMVSGMSADGGFSPLFALFRIGRGSSVVDNVSSGGLVCIPDIETGKIITDGLCRYPLQFHTVHPDSHLRFRDTQMPQWADLLAITEKAHRKIPGQALIGWDFAWSKSGWVLVEVNPAPGFASYQMFFHKGIRPLLIEKKLM